jgi:hypothetical protein
MPAARNGSVWSIVLLLALFLAGAWDVMVAPLITGELYPAYSSLRTDPLGAKALFESLAEQPGLDVARLYKARSPLDADTTLFIMGVDSAGWSESSKPMLQDYEQLLKNGGRIVIAFLPANVPPTLADAGAIQEQWNIRPRYRKIPRREERDSGGMPRESALYFEAGPEWRVLEESHSDAVIIERDLAGGTLVLAADSYPLSNQGLAEESDGTLISLLIGSAKRIRFDENQFGLSETGSAAVLIRKYRLGAAVGLLIAVAGLFIWRNSFSFLSPREDARSAPVSGRDSHEGLAALLRRNIPPGQLLSACWKEWTRSAPQPSRAERVQSEVQHWSGRDPIAGYRAICHTLTEKK